MQTDDAKIIVLKLAHDSSNWVIYWDCMLWSFGTNSTDSHFTHDSPPAPYVAIGQVNGLDINICWAKEEAYIKQLIVGTIPDTAFTKIKSCTSVKDIWDILKCINKEKSMAIMADLIWWFWNKCCADNENVWTHFKFLAALCEQLAAIGNPISDTDYAMMLLSSLPPFYDHACSSLSASMCISGNALTAEMLIQFIQDEQEHHTICTKKNGSNDEAFIVEGGNKKKKRKNEQYTNCHKNGHTKAECWAKGRDWEGQWPKKGKKSSTDSNQQPKHDTGAKAGVASEASIDILSWTVELSEEHDDPMGLDWYLADDEGSLTDDDIHMLTLVNIQGNPPLFLESELDLSETTGIEAWAAIEQVTECDYE